MTRTEKKDTIQLAINAVLLAAVSIGAGILISKMMTPTIPTLTDSERLALLEEAGEALAELSEGEFDMLLDRLGRTDFLFRDGFIDTLVQMDTATAMGYLLDVFENNPAKLLEWITKIAVRNPIVLKHLTLALGMSEGTSMLFIARLGAVTSTLSTAYALYVFTAYLEKNDPTWCPTPFKDYLIETKTNFDTLFAVVKDKLPFFKKEVSQLTLDERIEMRFHELERQDAKARAASMREAIELETFTITNYGVSTIDRERRTHRLLEAANYQIAVSEITGDM